VRRVPGQVHPWHCDIESCAPEGGFVTVWVGVEHTSRDSALQVISRSHRIGQTVQEARREAGIGRELATPEAMLQLARSGRRELIWPDMRNGEALYDSASGTAFNVAGRVRWRSSSAPPSTGRSDSGLAARGPSASGTPRLPGSWCAEATAPR
jgi:hypothetical protein